MPPTTIHAHSCNHYFLADAAPLIFPGPLPSSRQYNPEGIVVYQILLHPSLALDCLPLQQCHMENTAASCWKRGSQYPQTWYLTCSPPGDRPLDSQKSIRAAGKEHEHTTSGPSSQLWIRACICVLVLRRLIGPWSSWNPSLWKTFPDTVWVSRTSSG